MAIPNYNDTTPAAPAGMTNVKFQSDASGNVSGYWPVGAWQTWAPVVSGSSGMTVTITSLIMAQYLRTGPIIHFDFVASLTIGAPLSSVIYVGMPIALVGPGGYWPAVLTGAVGAPAQASFYNASTVQIVKLDNSNYPAGVVNVVISADYRCG